MTSIVQKIALKKITGEFQTIWTKNQVNDNTIGTRVSVIDALERRGLIETQRDEFSIAARLTAAGFQQNKKGILE